MSREAKIIIYAIILLASIAFKFDESFKRLASRDSSSSEVQDEEITTAPPVEYSDEREENENIYSKNNNDANYKINKRNVNNHKISVKLNGYSPYDYFFGKGIYNNELDNSIKVSAPVNSDIVFLLKDISSGRVIRNEYINKGTTFNLSGIPYGTYVFSYFSGNDWSDDVKINNGEIVGGFTKDKSFSKSEKIQDHMKFETGYYGSYTIQLTQVVNGNLETKNITEDDFFK